MIPLKSKITNKLLNYLFLNPQDSFYLNELERKLQVDKRNLAKKINELEIEGLLQYENRGNLKLFSLNQKYPLYQEYKKIILKTSGFEQEIKNLLKKIRGINEAYIFGSYAKDNMEAHSDIDLLVIGNHNIAALQNGINKIQVQIGREINVVNMDLLEYKNKIKAKNPFITGILKQKHIRII